MIYIGVDPGKNGGIAVIGYDYKGHYETKQRAFPAKYK